MKSSWRMVVHTPKSEKEWRVQADAETLVRAKEIQMDKARYRAALKYCKEKCEQYEAVAGEDDD